MPRQKRLDILGCIYHVMARGNNRKRLFKDKQDYEEFLKRLELTLAENGCECYAWVLMSNHYHLLLRPIKKPLKKVMQSLQSGYVGYFNRRHKRVGHLFQGRYKSILCQEDAYFLELIRYIHLNPIRAKLVINMQEFNKYKWSGHSSIIGGPKRSWQNINEVLSRFSNTEKAAIKSYKAFIKDGLNMGYRKDLIGGGLLRSAGGMEGIRLLRKLKEKWNYDDRILGDGSFVDSILDEAEEEIDLKEKIQKQGWDLKKLAKRVCVDYDIEVEDLISGQRKRNLSLPKGIFCYIARDVLNRTQTEIASFLNMRSANSVYKAQKKGKEFIKDKYDEYLNKCLSVKRPL